MSDIHVLLSLDLLRTFYAEGMVDNRTFLAWLVQQTATCNLAQLGFVARLADEYVDGMLLCRALTRPFVEACLTRLTEVRQFSLSSSQCLIPGPDSHYPRKRIFVDSRATAGEFGASKCQL